MALAYESHQDGAWEDYYNPATELTESAWSRVSVVDRLAWSLDSDTVGVSLHFASDGFISGAEYNAEEWQRFMDRIEEANAEDSDNDDAAVGLQLLKEAAEILQRVAEMRRGECDHPSAMSEWSELAERMAELDSANGITQVLSRCLPDEWEST